MHYTVKGKLKQIALVKLYQIIGLNHFVRMLYLQIKILLTFLIHV